MTELKDIKATVHPTDTLLVVDAMTGQEAASLVKSFNDQVCVMCVGGSKYASDQVCVGGGVNLLNDQVCVYVYVCVCMCV